MGGIPVKSEEAPCNEETRRVGDGLADIVNNHWPVDVLTIKMEVHLKSITIRSLREIAECTIFPGGMPGPSLECFACSCTERLEARCGHEQWGRPRLTSGLRVSCPSNPFVIGPPISSVLARLR